MTRMRLLWRSLSELGARGKLHLEGRALAQRRLHPDATTMHLDDLLGDRKPESSASSRLGQRAVDLMELLENANLLLFGNAWPGIGHADVEVAVDRLGTHTHLADVCELDGVPNEIEQHLCEALFVAEANWERLVHGRRERQLLVLGERLGGRAHRLDHT